jgi:hypothetical protein
MWLRPVSQKFTVVSPIIIIIIIIIIYRLRTKAME